MAKVEQRRTISTSLSLAVAILVFASAMYAFAGPSLDQASTTDIAETDFPLWNETTAGTASPAAPEPKDDPVIVLDNWHYTGGVISRWR